MPDSAEPNVGITEKARRHVLAIRAEEEDAEELALWIEVTGVAGADWAYDLYFSPADAAAEGDLVQRHDDLTLVVPRSSSPLLEGATLDMSRDLLQPGLILNNPNRPPQPIAAGGPSSPAQGSPAMAPLDPGELTGDLATRVATVLDRQVNPGIAAHGGKAELVGVEGDVVYLRLLGGCVGCGMAAVTLSQGIDVAIRQNVPDVSRIVDVTDHDSGTNPYYEAAKK